MRVHAALWWSASLHPAHNPLSGKRKQWVTADLAYPLKAQTYSNTSDMPEVLRHQHDDDNTS